MSRDFNLRMALLSCLLVLGVAASGFTLLAPARAGAAMQQLVSYTCSEKQPCLSVVSSSSAKAIVAAAETTSAVEGRKLINNNKRPLAALNSYEGALNGLDLSTNTLDTNAGVVGRTENGTGVAGITSFDSSQNGFFQMGTLGLDYSKTISENSGVRGQSIANAGVYGYSFGIPITSCGGILCTNSGVGVAAEADKGLGVKAFGAVAVAAIGNGRRFPALAVFNEKRGPLMAAWGGASNTTEVLSLDINGNLMVAGAVTQHGSPMTIRATSHGDEVGTFAPTQSAPTMEDFGEGQLVDGRAVVRLDPRFASTIDRSYRYLVFLTPQGDSNGLYVAQKTADAFLVREHDETPHLRERRASSNVVFDYRIVAQPYGPAAERLPAYDETRDSALTAGMLASVKANLARSVRSPRLEP